MKIKYINSNVCRVAIGYGQCCLFILALQKFRRSSNDFSLPYPQTFVSFNDVSDDVPFYISTGK